MPFFARPRAIALGSKPPLVTRIARTGLGTRLCPRKQSVLDTEKLLSFHGGKFLKDNHYLAEVEYVEMVASWHKKSLQKCVNGK